MTKTLGGTGCCSGERLVMYACAIIRITWAGIPPNLIEIFVVLWFLWFLVSDVVTGVLPFHSTVYIFAV